MTTAGTSRDVPIPRLERMMSTSAMAPAYAATTTPVTAAYTVLVRMTARRSKRS